MLDQKIIDILDQARSAGWVLEPEAKKLLSLKNMAVPSFRTAATSEAALKAAGEIGYPVVAKVVSPDILHKADVKGVNVGIANETALKNTFEYFSGLKGFREMLIEELVDGLELIVGGKIDFQFGPVVIMGIGGTGVEIYKDTALRMAPLNENDVLSMVDSLTAHKVLKGYRGSEPVNMKKLSELLIAFSNLMMELEDRIESVDLNPVMCSSKDCIVADARIILK